MTKRFLAWLMTLTMLLSVVPAVSLGAGAQETDADISQLSEGSQKLTGNMTLTDVWEISGEVKLDLNGYTLTMSDGGKLVVPAGAKLTCKNGTITGATNGAIDVSGTLELTEVTMTGNETAGTGAAIAGKGNGQIVLTDVIITGNTATAGAAVSVIESAKISVSGDTVIADNTNVANTADVVVADKLYVNQLTGGSNITVQTTADQTDANQVLAVSGEQTATWQAGWVNYMKLDGTTQFTGYITSGDAKTFAFGHYHGDQLYTAYNGGTNHNLIRTLPGYFYLTHDVVRSATSSKPVSLDKDATQYLCLNGHTITHRNPAIRLYNLDAGDNLIVEDCTSYRNEKGEFIAGGYVFGGASDSTSEDGSFALVNTGAQLTLENIKVTGFHSTVSPALRVKGETETRAVLNMTGVELTDNSNVATAAVIYGNTGATINMTDCVITGNTSKSATALSTGGDAQVTITDCIITGNTSNTHGAINVANGKTMVKLVGKTQVYGNTGGNLHLQKGSAYVYNLDGLTQGAKVGVSLQKARIDAGQLHFTAAVANGNDILPYCFSDDDTYQVAVDGEGRLALTLKPVEPEHAHCLEGSGACTDHELVEFTAWDDATKLPDTSGKYYLTTDVTVSDRAGLTDVDVILCLNGHTIQAADAYAKSRAFYLRGTAKLTLTDCAEAPGKITGFQNTAIVCDAGCTDAQVNLYNIELSGNTQTGTGACIVLRGTSVLNMHSGRISGNQTPGNAAGIYADGNATVNLLGGEISGNTAGGNGGGVVLEGKNVKGNLSGTKITGNTAGGNGGGILLSDAAQLEMTSGEISGNTAATNGAGVYVGSNSSMVMSGGKISENIAKKYTAGISVQSGAKLTLSGDAQITGNNSEGSYGGLYIHNANGGVSISGNVQISGNTCKGQMSNLYLAGTSRFNAGKLGENGNVGISTGRYFRPISNQVTEDVSAGYFSDNKSLAISYQDNALYLGAPDGHSHCLCTADSNHCSHAQVKFAPWESTTSLPESGSWYLTSDVVLSNRAGLEDVTLELCLNGYTVRVDENYQKGRAFYIYGAAKLTVTDCNEKPGVITGAKETAVMFDGGCEGAEYNMYNITMSGNATTTAGGAVLLQGASTFNMYSGTLTDNAAYTVLSLDAEGNPVLDEKGNQVPKKTMGGGAIASTGARTVMNLYGGKITNNSAYRLEYLKADGSKTTAGGSGGAIYAKGNLDIYDSVEISGNVAQSNGGAILVGGNDTTITIHGGRITGNTGRSGGGLISQNRTDVIMNGGEFSGNTATSNAGGVYLSTNSRFTMNGGKIAQNTASGSGGGMYVNGAVAMLNAGSVQNNKATSYGGGIASKAATVTVNGEKVDQGAVITIGKDFSVIGNAAKSAGGVQIYGKNSQLTLDGGSISNNTAKSNGGGVMSQSNSSVNLKSGKISGNQANVGGGCYISANTTMKMTGGAITGNATTKSYGAGVYMLGSVGYFSGGTISYNTSGSSGGGIYMGGATAYLQGTYLGNNTAKTNGGGLGCGQKSVTTNGVTTVRQSKVVLAGSTVAGNQAVNGGGIILQSNAVLEITSGEICDNKASSNGGGVNVTTNSTVSMTGGSLHDNYAKNSGSAVYHNKTGGHYSGVKFYNNHAENNGTIYLSDRVVGANSVLSFTNCKFYNNQTGADGGAFFGGRNCQATMTECIFTENTAGEDGGAILCRGNVTMTNCQVSDNRAGSNGGGIATDKCGIRGSKLQEGLVLIDTTVSNNTAGGQGGGLCLRTGCRTTMTDVEITGNTAAAEGGAYWAVDDTTFRNLTVTGNTAGGQGYAAWYDYSVYDGHSYFVGVHKISGDMIFKDNVGGDMYFGQEVSMAVDYEGLGEKTRFGVTLDAGVLTNRLYGEYDYEGGNQVYTVTYGSRSLTDTEIDENMMSEETQPTVQPKKTEASNLLLYVGVGLVALILIVVAVILVKKKNAGKPANKA